VPDAAAVLRGVPLLGVLPEPVLERLARDSATAVFPAGSTILREGEPGDRFYVVSSGTVGILGKELGPGEPFGEIALLRDVPRTATATAVTDVSLVTLERAPFVAAVTGHAPSTAAADTLIAARLGSLNARGSASV
jgi:CRP-like cAMP-binding protein